MHRAVALLLFSALVGAPAVQSPDPIPFEFPRWNHVDSEVVEVGGRAALQGTAILQDAGFGDGVIEYDVYITGARSYPGIYFRLTETNDAEHFYIRPHRASLYPDAVQYTPVINGIAVAPPLAPSEAIVFQSSRAGSLDIFAMAPDGTLVRQLTSGPATDHSPALSPDGSLVAFVSDRDGGQHVYVVGAGGGDPRRATAGVQEETEPTWSADGRLVFRKPMPEGSAAWMLDVGSGEATEIVAPLPGLTYPSVSPAGSEILFSVSDADGIGIWVVDMDGGRRRRVPTPTAWAMMPRWSPDGTRIVYASATDPPFRGGTVEIHVTTPDGAEDTVVTDAGTVSEFPCWSPDGSRIAFQRFAGGNFEVFVVNADGTGLGALTENAGLDGRPSWAVAGDDGRESGS